MPVKAILGLGNPGLRFKSSRHNLGFMVVEKLAQIRKIRIKEKTFHCLMGQGKINNQDVFLVKPLTYVNLSGQVASLIVKRKKISLQNLLVICDDVNLPLGKMRMRACGSDGGHKGLRSIIEVLASRDFPRLRIGVGLPQAKTKSGQLSRYVLGRFNKRESRIINAAVEKAVSASIIWATEGIAAAMNIFN